MKRSLRIKLITTTACILMVCVGSALGATYYVKWDAAGTGNGTSWVNAYTTISAAIAAHTDNGDIIEVSGGPTGHTYSDVVDFRYGGTATLRGSEEAGHAGMVTISGTGGEDSPLIVTGKTIENLTLTTATAAKYSVSIFGNATFNKVILKDSPRAILGSFGTTLTATFNSCVIKNHSGADITIAGYTNNTFIFNNCLIYNNVAHLQTHEGTLAFNNCVIAGNHGANGVIKCNSEAAVVNINNCILTANVSDIANYGEFNVVVNASGGTVNVANSILQKHPTQPGTYGYENITDGGGNQYVSPKIVSQYGGKGLVSIGTDEDFNAAPATNIFTRLADYAYSKGIRAYVALESVQSYTAQNWADLTAYAAQGHELCIHTKYHINGSVALSPGIVTIDGPANGTVSISINRVSQYNSSTWTGTVLLKEGGDTVKTIDISYSQISGDGCWLGLVNSIKAQAGWTASNAAGDAAACIFLADQTDLDVSSATALPVDIDRWMHVDYVEASKLMKDNTGYEPRTVVYPGGVFTSTMKVWLADQANWTPLGLTAPLGARTAALASGSFTRTGTGFVSGTENKAGCQIFEVSSPQLSVSIGTGAISEYTGAMLDWLGHIGGQMTFYTHGTDEYSLANLYTFIDTLASNSSVTVMTPGEMFAQIRSEGSDVDEDGLRWLVAEADNANYRLLSSSPAIDTGTDVGLRSDGDGFKAPVGKFDIGAFEYGSSASTASPTFYVSNAGNDSNTGLTTADPWLTVAKVNAYSTFQPDDTIAFASGGTWREQLTAPASGTSGHPITFGTYGSGEKPIISGSDILTGWSSTVSPEETGGVFASGFETESLTDWTSLTTFGGSIARSATAKHNTNYGMLYTVTSASDCRGTANKTFSEITSGSAYLRWYFYIPTGTIDNSKTWTMMRLQDASTLLMHVALVTDGSGNITLSSSVTNPTGGLVDPGSVTVSRNVWHYIEVRYKIDASTGGGEIWLDGVSKANRYNLDTSTRAPDNFYIGQGGFGTISALGSTAYFDDVKLDTSAIGASSSPPANSYDITLAADPQMVWFDGTHGVAKESAALLGDDKDFYYDSEATKLYVLSTSAPSGRTIEGGKRSYGINTNGKDYLTIQNLQLEKTKEWGAGVRCYQSHYVTVDSCTLTNNYYSGFLGSGDSHGNMTVSNNTVTYNGGPGIISWYGGTPDVDDGVNLYTLNTITNNVWRNVENSPIQCELINSTISYNTIGNNAAAADCPDHLAHNHGIYCGTMTNTNADVHHNTVYNTGSGSGIKVLGNASIHHNLSYNNYQAGITVGFNSSGNNTSNVFNNILYGNHFGIWQYGNTDGTLTLNIYSNTIYGNYDTTINQWTYEIYIGDDLANLLIKNNIISGSAASHWEIASVAQTGTVAIDYNLHANNSNSIFYDSANRTFAYWQETLGHDVNGSVADPLFVNAAGGDFRLQATSPAKAAGVPILTYAQWIAAGGDMAGRNPTNGTISMGAYQFQKRMLLEDDFSLTKKSKSTDAGSYVQP